jgi:hypothetical protein
MGNEIDASHRWMHVCLCNDMIDAFEATGNSIE